MSDYVYMKCPEQPKFTDKSRFVTAQGWGGIGQESNCYWFGEQGDENVPKLDNGDACTELTYILLKGEL